MLGPTYPNREYLHSAQSGGNKTNAFPTDTGTASVGRSIWDKLAAANVPSRYYYSDLPLLALWGQHGLGYSSPIADYFQACASGTLPNVTMVDPNFVGPNQCDDHPLADVRAGQRYLRDVFKAFVQSPHWEHGAFIVTYDEWGGFFDHVRPPAPPRRRARAPTTPNDFGQAGFRVPTVLASPYARPGFVDHRQYDHTSILRFLEWRFLGAPPEGPGKDTDSWFLTAARPGREQHRGEPRPDARRRVARLRPRHARRPAVAGVRRPRGVGSPGAQQHQRRRRLRRGGVAGIPRPGGILAGLSR